ncbi:MAG: metallophosphoesterase [Nanoarchaeota archaeon]
MKILHISDIHEDSEALAKALDFASAFCVEHVICTGDLLNTHYTLDGWRRYATGSRDNVAFRDHVIGLAREKYEGMKAAFERAGIPYTVVPGNYEVSCFYDVFGDRVLHNMWSEFIDVKMAGYGGSPGALPEQASKVIELTSGIRPYTRVMQGFSEAELSDLLTKEKPKVIMSHTPPYEVLDRTIGGRNKGTGALRIYLDNTGGTADEVNSVLCGHIHESGPLENNDAGFAGIAKIGNTVVSNAGNLGRFGLYDGDTCEAVPGLGKGDIGWGTFAILEMTADGKITKADQFLIRSRDNTKVVGDVRQIGQYIL